MRIIGSASFTAEPCALYGEITPTVLPHGSLPPNPVGGYETASVILYVFSGATPVSHERR